MKRQLVYSCKAHKEADYLSKDDVLVSQFREWRFGSNEFICRNEVLQADLFHEHNRTPIQILNKAKECLGKAMTDSAKLYFQNMIDKFTNIVIYSVR